MAPLRPESRVLVLERVTNLQAKKTPQNTARIAPSQRFPTNSSRSELFTTLEPGRWIAMSRGLTGLVPSNCGHGGGCNLRALVARPRKLASRISTKFPGSRETCSFLVEILFFPKFQYSVQPLVSAVSGNRVAGMAGYAGAGAWPPLSRTRCHHPARGDLGSVFIDDYQNMAWQASDIGEG